jgi:K+-sensing histidine kinase KdpD
MLSNEVDSLSRQLLTPLQALKLDAEYHENTFAVSQAKKALDILESSLLLHRLNTRQQALELGPVHVGEVVHRVVTALREYFHELQIDYEVDYQKELPAVDADRLILEHAIKMLCYGVQSYNSQGAFFTISVTKDANQRIKISITSKGVNYNSLTLKSQNNRHKILPSNSIESSQALFQSLGGNLYKTAISKSKGFGVALPVSKQLSLV